LRIVLQKYLTTLRRSVIGDVNSVTSAIGQFRKGIKMKKTILLVLVLTFGLVSVSLAAEDTWTYKTNMPTARVFVGGCVLDGKIYVIGGAPSSSSVTRAVEMYDPVVDTWTRMSNMPSGRCYPAICTLDGKIYVFGGSSPSMWSSATKNVYVYDPQADTWTQKANMPYANAGCGIAVVDNTIYLIGGTLSESKPPVSRVMAYNPVTESWTLKADMPTARGFFSTCVVDGKIYAIGGSTQNWRAFAYKNVEVYDPLTNTWTRKSDMPTQRWSLGTCVVDGKIFAIGGGISTASTTANEVYNPVTDTWTTNSPMQQKRYGLFVASIGDKIYAIGGSVPGMLSTVEEYYTGFIVTPSQPDFNGDGLVDIKDLLKLIQSWGQDDPVVDIAPPSGDGVIDVLDLELLMSHWGQEVDDPTLIAHWALDEVEGEIAYDSVGINHAYIIGEPVWHPEGGKVGGALMFDGVDDYALTQYGPNPADGSFSIFAWVKGGLPGQVILSQMYAENWLCIDSIEGNLMTELKASGRSGGPLQSQTVIPDGNWHHIGLVWNGSFRTLYVDGITVAEDTQDGLEGSDSGLNIGCDKNMEAGTYWSGLIDDVRIYNRVVIP